MINRDADKYTMQQTNHTFSGIYSREKICSHKNVYANGHSYLICKNKICKSYFPQCVNDREHSASQRKHNTTQKLRGVNLEYLHQGG